MQFTVGPNFKVDDLAGDLRREYTAEGRETDILVKNGKHRLRVFTGFSKYDIVMSLLGSNLDVNVIPSLGKRAMMAIFSVIGLIAIVVLFVTHFASTSIMIAGAIGGLAMLIILPTAKFIENAESKAKAIMEKYVGGAADASGDTVARKTPKDGSSFCLNCGTKLPPGAKFCNKCGAKVAS